jgi:hypothetical protein
MIEELEGSRKEYRKSQLPHLSKVFQCANTLKHSECARKIAKLVSLSHKKFKILNLTITPQFFFNYYYYYYFSNNL